MQYFSGSSLGNLEEGQGLESSEDTPWQERYEFSSFVELILYPK